MFALQFVRFSPKSTNRTHCLNWLTSVCFLLHYICLLFIQISEICQCAFQWIRKSETKKKKKMATDNLFKVPNDRSSCHWKASEDNASSFVVYVLQLTIMYQSHQVLDSLCSLSPLAPWLPQLTQTVKEVPKQQGLSVLLLIFNNVLPPKIFYYIKHTGKPKSLTATYSCQQDGPLNCCLISLISKSVEMTRNKAKTALKLDL